MFTGHSPALIKDKAIARQEWNDRREKDVVESSKEPAYA